MAHASTGPGPFLLNTNERTTRRGGSGILVLPSMSDAHVLWRHDGSYNCIMLESSTCFVALLQGPLAL